MKKLALLLFALPLLTSLSAKADQSIEAMAPAQSYNCHINGNMKGLTIAIGLGGEVIKGNGVISCQNEQSGAVTRYPIRMSLVGGGAGFEFSYIKNVTVRTAGIRTSDPHTFFRQYGIGATTGATLGRVGLDFDIAFRVDGDARGEGFEVGLSGKDAVGLGAHLFGMGFKIARR